METMNETALLIVDLQNDFCPGGALAVTGGDQIVPVVNDLISVAVGRGMPIFASRDWHPEATSHFNTHGGPWPPHCRQTTKGAEFHPKLRLPADRFTIISKGTKPDQDAYSAFDGKDRFGVTLLKNLESASVKKIYIAGLALDYCVKATALDAKKNGFEVVVFENATRAVNIKPNDGRYAKAEMWNTGIKIMDFPEFD